MKIIFSYITGKEICVFVKSSQLIQYLFADLIIEAEKIGCKYMSIEEIQRNEKRN